jgi:hypothetical protein
MAAQDRYDIGWQPENNSFGMVMLKEWTQRDYQKLWLTGDLKEGKNEVFPEETEEMGYIQPW